MRTYGKVQIEDAFIQTSYRSQLCTVDYTLTNSDSFARTVMVAASATRSGIEQLSLMGSAMELAPGETRVVQLTLAWEDPALWSPESPQLYHLESRLEKDAVTVDAEVRRFGFREPGSKGIKIIQVEETVYPTGIATGPLELGEHIDIPYTFQVPYTGDSTMEVVLRTWKGRVKKFEEAKRFFVTEAGDGQSSNLVGIAWGEESVDFVFTDGFESGSTCSWYPPE